MILRNISPRKFVLIVLCVFLSLFSSAQEKISVSGKVTDGNTNLPIPYAHVFFNNSTLGAVTDSIGRYRIHGIPAELREMVVSSIGYITLKYHLNLQPYKYPIVNFKMVPDNTVLSSIVINGKRDIDSKRWNKQFDRFKEVFLGQNPNAKSTEILNRYVLSFETVMNEGQATDGFVAHANLPLQIENRALGYRLLITLDEFWASTTSYKMLFSTRFDTLTARSDKEKERWQRNRLKTYKGSPRHFFKSVREGRYVQEGFEKMSGGTFIGFKAISLPPFLFFIRSGGECVKSGAEQHLVACC